MAMSTFQKVTLATCLVLCVALLLPKMLLSGGRKDAAEGSGRFPSMMQRQAAPEGRGQRAAGSRANNPEAVTRTKGAGTGAGTGGKSNLAGQIIPVYGFGILLYILYILFKITSKGNNKPSESRFPSVRSENTKRKITDFELAQLQDKLRETELVMENIVSNVNHSPDRVKGVTADQEESLLQQLTEITRVMQEGQMVDDLAPEKKTQEDWEVPADYPEEPPQQWEHSRCCCQHSQHPHRTETETETERTQADGADPEDGCVAGGGEAAEGAAEPNKERESDFPAGSGETAGPGEAAVGPGEAAVGPGEEAVGSSEEAVGPGEEAVGLSEEAVGLSEEAVGLSEEAVGLSEEAVGLSEEAVGLSEEAVGVSEEAVGLSEEAVGVSEEAVGPGEETVGLSEEAVGQGEAAVGPGEEAVGPGEEAGGPGEEAVGLSEEAVGPGEAAVGLSEETVGLSEEAVGQGEAAVGPGEEAVGPGEAEASQRGDGAGEMELGVPEDGIAGVLEELELTLKMTSAMEQEKVEDLSRATETEASCGTVRRRNKRRRAKKAAH